MVGRLLPPINVHVWGGLGSQLFAIVLAWRIVEKFTYRRVKLVFHTSGLTERKREIPTTWLGELTFRELEDFQKRLVVNEPAARSIINSRFHHYLLYTLIRLGILSRANTDDEFSHLKPWALEVRGHYSQFKIEALEISNLMKLIGLATTNSSEAYCTIHYRLGDLMQITGKSYIDPKRLRLAYEQHSSNYYPLVVLSDSKSENIEKVFPKISNRSIISYLNLKSFETIAFCYESKEFFGTNSKLSLWIAIFRIHSEKQGNILPSELSHHISSILNQEQIEFALRFY